MRTFSRFHFAALPFFAACAINTAPDTSTPLSATTVATWSSSSGPAPSSSSPSPPQCGLLGFSDVKDVVQMRCGGCHMDPPEQGASVPLMTAANFHAVTPLSAGRPLYADTADRLTRQDRRHMPPEGAAQLDGDEKRLLVAWASGGGFEFPCNADGGVSRPVPGYPPSNDITEPADCGSGVTWQDVGPLLARNRCTECHDGSSDSIAALALYGDGLEPTGHPYYAPMNLWQVSLARMLDRSMPPPMTAIGEPLPLSLIHI